MEIEVIGDDGFGNDAYSHLFDDIMSDLNKAVLIEKAKLVLRPETPLFVFSIVLKAEPTVKTIPDVSNVRVEANNIHLTIVQERYAPAILSSLWGKYGRRAVVQQTRFDLDVIGAKEEEIAQIVVSSGEEDKREILGAIWRTMPEGIKNRKVLMDGNVITVVATEEIMRPEMIKEGQAVHEGMGGAEVV
ncbi:MAG: methanogenesis marker 17 protein [Candidatus Methanomethylophilaceae archaeon]|jgi:putative methanogenesis marker protein 17|nr:methanogenesis marker 17 protein [Thermoplasmata archaeon]MBR4181689.1 methanogenesis marker 17 protein [Candidatus Methanomethylophilaceae archaeon]MBR4217199.1 methanogenesis marker 17 protein [Candidatus Methanomethylophilaceae archaeon]MBR4698221.1 methanogenesis marker 17 protein [Candidatus Methanomethylophilaceae archaeon]MBR6871625.1 methanogenesis marker 17 protein [Candidatus Methanomethylophilaceae archaeon]